MLCIFEMETQYKNSFLEPLFLQLVFWEILGYKFTAIALLQTL